MLVGCRWIPVHSALCTDAAAVAHLQWVVPMKCTTMATEHTSPGLNLSRPLLSTSALHFGNYWCWCWGHRAVSAAAANSQEQQWCSFFFYCLTVTKRETLLFTVIAHLFFLSDAVILKNTHSFTHLLSPLSVQECNVCFNNGHHQWLPLLVHQALLSWQLYSVEHSSAVDASARAVKFVGKSDKIVAIWTCHWSLPIAYCPPLFVLYLNQSAFGFDLDCVFQSLSSLLPDNQPVFLSALLTYPPHPPIHTFPPSKFCSFEFVWKVSFFFSTQFFIAAFLSECHSPVVIFARLFWQSFCRLWAFLPRRVKTLLQF